MKPLHLELYGFGAFAEPCKISFTDWQDGEVFLITGETGAGKTTIFDAICFALYGTASGSERESRQFRSQYLTDSTAETKVRLEFLDNGKRYLVERNPAYERQKQRGIGTVEQKANATLYELLPNGEKTCICSGFKTVTCEITERIGMESTQFQQIVMIAQGEFRRFLLSNSIEKGQILSKLFHTESCGRIRDRLKQRYDAKTQEISMQTISIAAKLKTVAPHEVTRKQQYQELLAEEKTVATSPICCQLLEEDCRERLEQLPLLEKEQERFQQSVDQLVQQMEQGRRHNQNCFRLEQQQKELQQLQQRQTVAAELLERAEINAVQIPEWQDAAAQLERSVPEYQHLADLQKELLTLQKQSQQLQQEQAQKKATLEQTQQACAMLQKEVEEHQDKNGTETAGVAGFAAVAAAVCSGSTGGGRLCRIRTAGTASSPAVLSGREAEIRCDGTAVLSEHGRQSCSTVASRGSVSGLRLSGASASGRADAADGFGAAVSACQKTAGSGFAGDAEPEEPVRETAGSLCTAANAETAVVAAA